MCGERRRLADFLFFPAAAGVFPVGPLVLLRKVQLCSPWVAVLSFARACSSDFCGFFLFVSRFLVRAMLRSQASDMYRHDFTSLAAGSGQPPPVCCRIGTGVSSLPIWHFDDRLHSLGLPLLIFFIRAALIAPTAHRAFSLWVLTMI